MIALVLLLTGDTEDEYKEEEADESISTMDRRYGHRIKNHRQYYRASREDAHHHSRRRIIIGLISDGPTQTSLSILGTVGGDVCCDIFFLKAMIIDAL